MKNGAIIILSVLLAITGIFAIYSHWQGADKEKAVEDANRRIAQLERNIEQKAKELSGTKQQHLAFKQTEQDLKYQLQAKAEAMINLQDQIEKANLQAAQFERQLRLKNQELVNCQTDILKLKQTQGIYQDQIQSKEDTLANLQTGLKEANLRIAQFENELKSKNQKIAAAKEKVAALGQRERTCKVRLQENEDSIENLKKQLENATIQVAALQDKIKQQENELARLDQQFGHAQDQKDQYETKITELESAYNALYKKFQRNIENNEATIKKYAKQLSVTFVNRILFDSGKATITSRGKEILKNTGNILKQIKGGKIRVIGHTDNVPIAGKLRHQFPTNWELSGARAAAVVRFFQNKNKIDPHTMESIGRSLYWPIASNDTKEGRAKNRRVEIIITSKL